jgi:type IV secretory pathway VirB10-like protein
MRRRAKVSLLRGRDTERPIMLRTLRFAFVLTLLLAIAGPVSAQSLADVARHEGSRRKQIKKPSRVLTNKDLRPSETPPPPPQPPQEAQPPAKAEGTTPSEPEVSEEDKRQKDEQAWRQRMTDARQALERSQMYLDALQSKINALWADFTARDDRAQREVIETERKKALAEYDRVKLEIEANKKAIDDLEEEARRAGVPPGWLR